MHNLEKLDQSFSVISETEAREVLGGLAAPGGLTLSNPSTTTVNGTTQSDKDVDDEWS